MGFDSTRGFTWDGEVDRFLPYFLPLIAAMLYVVGALLVKRSADYGVGVWRTAFVANLLAAALFQLAYPFGGTFHLDLLWQPAGVSVLFLLGQIFNYLALQYGDVSVATPVLGVKIILVGLFTTLLLGQPLTVQLWAAAVLSSAAVAMLNVTGGGKHRRVALTALFAGSSAAMFALFDVLVQKWSPAWGAGRFLPVMIGFVAVFSLGLIPFFHAPLRKVPRAALPWLLGGCAIIGFQSLLFVTAVVVTRNATASNVIYSSRGLWSVIFVWGLGHWFAHREGRIGSGLLGWRLAGAVLMTGAVALALFD